MIRDAAYWCLRCGHAWRTQSKQVTCPKCGHGYVKWENWNERDWYTPLEREK